MKKEKGVTLISLIMYVLLMTFVVSAIAAITTSFNENLSEVDQDSESSVAFSKFNMYFLNDIKSKNAKIVSSTSSSINISYVDDEGQQTVSYSKKGDGLYRDKVKITDKVKDIKIQADSVSGTATIYLKIGKYEKKTHYKVEPPIDTENSNDV